MAWTWEAPIGSKEENADRVGEGEGGGSRCTERAGGEGSRLRAERREGRARRECGGCVGFLLGLQGRAAGGRMERGWWAGMLQEDTSKRDLTPSNGRTASGKWTPEDSSESCSFFCVLVPRLH